jgi:hypothetical protein
MLEGIELLSHNSKGLLMAIQRHKLNDKAEGNQIGSYGQSSGNPRKARPFLGLTKADLEQILSKYDLESSTEQTPEDEDDGE